MDVKEAITQLTGLKKYCEGMAECDESGSYVFDLDVQALDMAITALSPPNEPLTLKELREMDDEPVWCCPKNDSAKGSWMIVGPNGCENITSFAIYDDYGTGWLAYRRPPEVSP